MICDDGGVDGVEEFGGSDLSHDLAGLFKHQAEGIEKK